MRRIEAYLAEANRAEFESVLEDLPIVHAWIGLPQNDRVAASLLVRARDSGTVLDALEQRFGNDASFRVILLNVEATLPRLEPESPPEQLDAASDRSPNLRFAVSREELYARVVKGTEVSQTYTLTVMLSTIVAAVGLWRNDLAVIIGAMMIAPLLGPNVALALATTLADRELTRKSLRANLLGVTLALTISLVVGSILSVDPSVDAIASRTQVGVGDIVLALAAGCAGALAYSTSLPAALIGVMVAVALLPPLVVFGLLLASGSLQPASGAAMLLLVNVICVNLAGVVTFLWQGVQPRTWWEAERAKGRTLRAIAAWLALLIVLVAVMSLAV